MEVIEPVYKRKNIRHVKSIILECHVKNIERYDIVDLSNILNRVHTS